MHRMLLRQVIIDVPSEDLDEARRFWAGALDARTEQVDHEPEFTALRGPAALPWVALQDLGPGATARYHLDIETDDVTAEVTRLVRLGARHVEDGRGWVVLRDPAGLLLCVVDAESPDFAQRSRQVS